MNINPENFLQPEEEKEEIIDYIQPLLKVRRILKDVDFGLLVNDGKFETAITHLQLARALLQETEAQLLLYQHKKEELEVSELKDKLKKLDIYKRGTTE